MTNLIATYRSARNKGIRTATTTYIYGKEATHTILSLKLGGAEIAAIELGFTKKSTFQLVEGNLSRVFFQSPIDFSGSVDELESSDEEEETVSTFVEAADKKAVASEKKPGEAKKDVKKVAPKENEAKNETVDDEDEKDEDESSEEEEDSRGLLDEASEDDKDELDSEDEGDELDSYEDDEDDDEEMSDEDDESEEEELEQ